MIHLIMLALFVVFSIFHLIASWEDDKKKRAYTKPFLLIFLLLFYVFAAKKADNLLIMALLTSWLGDVLLIFKGHKWFAMGGISFMFSHFFFMQVYFRRIRLYAVSPVLLIPAALIYAFISLKIIRAVQKNTPKIMVFPMYFYLLTNSSMNLFALMQMLSTHSLGAVIAYTGAVLFFISDCTLFLVRYHSNENLIFKKHFTVMLTYLLGECLITIGILMLGG